LVACFSRSASGDPTSRPRDCRVVHGIRFTALGQSPTSEPAATFLEPFTLKLRVDKEHYYEQKFDKVPYVADAEVYLFLDDHFGVNLADSKAEFLTVTYQADSGKADVLLSLEHRKPTEKGTYS
jgi:hypothetical protein